MSMRPGAQQTNKNGACWLVLFLSSVVRLLSSVV
jgi:hypothetical protein